MNNLNPNRTHQKGWLAFRDRDPRHEKRIELRNFSFLDDPQATIDGMQQIAIAEATSPEAYIDFKDKYCLDVSPFMLLMEFWGQMLPIFEGGDMDFPMQKVLAAIGIPQAMGITVRGVTELTDVWAFPLARRRGAGSTTSRSPLTDAQSREGASDEFCDALDEWLSEMDMSLTETGIGWIKNILGELLENAERHGDGGRKDGAWSISGCMVRRKDNETGEHLLRVYIGIVNLGDTFSQTLDRALPRVQERLDRYVSHMRQMGAKQSPETLRTLAALQDGVTCDPEADTNDRGGYGLQEMLDLVSMLGHSATETLRPRITIVSGKACIQLREPYIRGQRINGSDTERLLWCNPSNSRDEPPDDQYVYDLDATIPGTTISIGFVLDRDYYESARSAGADHAND